MTKIKEGFKGERFVFLPEELLEKYSNDPLIENLYIRKIGFFPKVKFHSIQKDKGVDYAMLIYCTDGKVHTIFMTKLIKSRKTNMSLFPRMSRILLKPVQTSRGQSTGFIFVGN